MVAVVTNSGPNMVSPVQKAGWRHYPCFAHTLNLGVKDGIKAVCEIVRLLEKCSSIVSFFYYSTKATEKLKDMQKQLKVTEHKLIQSVETRWNSAFYMLERLLEQREAVTTALCILEKNAMCLSTEELTLIHPTTEALRHFKEATREITVTKCVFVESDSPCVTTS